MKTDTYIVIRKYLAYDDKYLGRRCRIVHTLGKDIGGREYVTVEFLDDGERESFPLDCLKNEAPTTALKHS